MNYPYLAILAIAAFGFKNLVKRNSPASLPLYPSHVRARAINSPGNSSGFHSFILRTSDAFSQFRNRYFWRIRLPFSARAESLPTVE